MTIKELLEQGKVVRVNTFEGTKEELKRLYEKGLIIPVVDDTSIIGLHYIGAHSTLEDLILEREFIKAYPSPITVIEWLADIVGLTDESEEELDLDEDDDFWDYVDCDCEECADCEECECESEEEVEPEDEVVKEKPTYTFHSNKLLTYEDSLKVIRYLTGRFVEAGCRPTILLENYKELRKLANLDNIGPVNYKVTDIKLGRKLSNKEKEKLATVLDNLDISAELV